ncbi:LysM peptidoglycan-binding domain-containing protein [Paenarthrobacter sp. CM16]|uniref:LysM peptidoglycan-binding domain-containing protein n=1 Tax=Paenarthrobacter sp. CM16 TaxID=2738447 RepID=UPI0015570CE9|nr:LysM peptidoglycan-binding domain-containing protein [Paenarthrobacter sp. CM16]NQD86301.1 LysM peptidoglycan-binding domain-containing protein [Paenarthrobacter sp. CM16]
MTTPRSPKRTMSMPVIAATTAALPAVVLSSLALAQPSMASPAPQPRKVPATLAAAMKAQAVNAGNVIPAQAVATTLPAALRPMAPSVPDTYTIVRGDTISAIARRFNLDTNAVLQLNKLSATTLIYPGQTIKLTGTASSAPSQPAAPAAPSTPSNATIYTVVSGDTLGAIAAKHGVPLSSIFSWNNLSGSSIIYPGQKIKVSGGSTPSAPAAPAPAPSPAPAPLATTGSYTIKAGDTLSSIASRHGVSLTALMTANNVSATTVIYPGQKLTIPGTGLQPAGTTTPLVPSTFLGFTYPAAVVSSANENKALLNASPVPSRAEMKSIVADTARRMGVSPSLALAFAEQESGFDQRAVSPANAIGTMQVIPSSGQWASDLVGRKLNLLDPYDNATAGVAIIRALIATSKDLDTAIAGYYQGQYSVSKYGMYDDTKRYVESIKARQRTFG